MVCSPHIGVLAGIASGGTPSYNFPRQISSYQQPSLYNGNYQGTSDSRRSYQPMAISNNLYSFQNNDGKNSNPLFMASENRFAQSKTPQKATGYNFTPEQLLGYGVFGVAFVSPPQAGRYTHQ